MRLVRPRYMIALMECGIGRGTGSAGRRDPAFDDEYEARPVPDDRVRYASLAREPSLLAEVDDR